jgi:isoquinoline 1-oxidoreductase beta subunit
MGNRDRHSPPGVLRRDLLRAAAGLSFGISLGGLLQSAAAAAESESGSSAQPGPYLWVRVDIDGTVTIRVPASDMGQGAGTALAVILAEELDADWDSVVIEPSPANDETFGNPLLGGLVLTVGSSSVSGYFDRLRLHGAQMRRILIQNVASQWQVPEAELFTLAGFVHHQPSRRRIGYGEIAAFAWLPDRAPQIAPDQLRPRAAFRLIGKDLPRRDIPGMVDGSTRYGIDVRLPRMLYGVMAYPAVHGGRVAAFREPDTSGNPDLVGVFNLDDRIGIVARSFTVAQHLRSQLEIDWDLPQPAARYDSTVAMGRFTDSVRNLSAAGTIWEEKGDVQNAFAQSGTVFERQYRSGYLYHAQMEPLSSVAWYKPDDSIEVWAGTQAPSHAKRAVAAALGVPETHVVLHRLALGGGFGRRAARDQDYVVDAALLSQRSGRPVKVIRTREDDVHWGRLKPMSAHLLRAGVDGEGRIIAWHHRVASEEPMTMSDPERYRSIGEAPVIAMLGSEQESYRFANRRSEHLRQDTGMRVSPLRGVGMTTNLFASESFIDEIAAGLGEDPVGFRLNLLRHSRRARNVLNAAAGNAQWQAKRRNRALGVAFCNHGGTLAACIAEVSVSRRERLIVHRIWAAVDPGIAIQPANVRAQIEGGIVFGLSNVLKEEITIRGGIVQQNNFDDYPILTAAETPEIIVQVLQGADKPTGVGETGTVLVPAAVANAFARLTGRRLREMPFTPDRLRRILT